MNSQLKDDKKKEPEELCDMCRHLLLLSSLLRFSIHLHGCLGLARHDTMRHFGDNIASAMAASISFIFASSAGIVNCCAVVRLIERCNFLGSRGGLRTILSIEIILYYDCAAVNGYRRAQAVTGFAGARHSARLPAAGRRGGELLKNLIDVRVVDEPSVSDGLTARGGGGFL